MKIHTFYSYVIGKWECIFRSNCYWNVLWLLMYLVGMGVFFVGMPKYYDDYWYMEHLRPWFEAQGVMVPENGGNIFSGGFPGAGYGIHGESIILPTI